MSPTRAPWSCARRLDACPPNASWPKRTAPTWRRCLAGARDRARPLPRAGASRRACRAYERWAAVWRRADVRSGRARAGSDEARRQPPVQRRDAARRRESRRPAERRALVRDGAARGRGPFLRRARDQGLRGGLGTGSAGRRAHRFSSGFAERVPAAAERRLRAGRVSPARCAARRLSASQGRRRSRVRAPTEAAAELARAGRARLARAGGRGARADRPPACNARRGARARGVRGAGTRTRMTRAPATAKRNLALVVGRAHDGRHELTTVYQRLDLVDRVAGPPAPGFLVIGVPWGPAVPKTPAGAAARPRRSTRCSARRSKRR